MIEGETATRMSQAGETAATPAPTKRYDLGLCLSGGGYRAMLFHAGALARMNDAGLLARLDMVSSVSGGSIAAGLLAVAWPRNGDHRNLRFAPALLARSIPAWSMPFQELFCGTIDSVVQVVRVGKYQDRMTCARGLKPRGL